MAFYPAFQERQMTKLKPCPFCGVKPEPAGGGGGVRSIKTVDGDLLELDAETLAAMRGEARA
jgi:hypothetical protein